MDKEVISKLIEEIEVGYEDIGLIQAKLPQLRQALEQAKQSRQWDSVMMAAAACPYEYLTISMWHAKEKGKELSREKKNDIWQQVRDLALEGLKAAMRLEDQETEEGFLFELARLSTNLGDFEQALDYIQQRLPLTPEQDRYREIGREAFFHGHRARAGKDYATARALYQLCLDLIDPANKAGIADILDFMAVVELDAGNRDLALELVEKSKKLRE